MSAVDLCEVCGSNPFKYKCPGCLKKTCSLACSKKHKADDGCSGQKYDPLQYVSNENIKDADDEKHESNYLVQRDFNFLSNMKRKLEVEKIDSKRKNRRTLQNSNIGTYSSNANSNNNALRKPAAEEECPRVIRRGVNCLLLPRGMHRSSMNKSKWDKALDLFVWSVEWIICPAQNASSADIATKNENDNNDIEHFIHVSHKVKETSSIVEGMSNVIFEKCCSVFNINKEDTIGDKSIAKDATVYAKLLRNNQIRSDILSQNGIRFYIKWFPYNTTFARDSRELMEIEPAGKCIGEIFRNRTVIEFPTIYIAKNEHDLPKGCKVLDISAVRELETRDDSSKHKYCGSNTASNNKDFKKIDGLKNAPGTELEMKKNDDGTNDDDDDGGDEPPTEEPVSQECMKESASPVHKLQHFPNEEDKSPLIEGNIDSDDDGYDPTI